MPVCTFTNHFSRGLIFVDGSSHLLRIYSAEFYFQRVTLSSGYILLWPPYADCRRFQNYILIFILISFCLNRIGGGSEFGKVDLSFGKFQPHVKIIHQCCRQRCGVVRIVLFYVCVNEANFGFMFWEDGYAWFQFDKVTLVLLGYCLRNTYLRRFPQRSFCNITFIL